MSDARRAVAAAERPASTAGRFRLRDTLVAGLAAVALVLAPGCTLQQQLLLALLPDGTFTVPLANMQKLSTGNQTRIDELTAREDWAGLVAFARENLRADPASGDWWTVKGSAEARLGDWRAARASFAEAVRLAPDSADAWTMLAQADGRLGDRPRAIATLEQARDAIRGNARIPFFLAEEYRFAGRFVDAERTYHEVLGLSPDFPEALHGLAIVQARLGKSEAAGRTLATLEKTQPDLAKRAAAAIAKR